MRALFVDQGRYNTAAAMGHVRVRHALRAGLAALGEPLEALEVTVPPFSALERRLVRYVPGHESGVLGSVRWHLARSRLARRLISEVLENRRPDVVHLTTDQVSLLLGRLYEEVPIVPSLDVLTVEWARMKRLVPATAPTPPDLRPLGLLERRSLERAPVAVAWTETVARSVRALAPHARVRVLHPGIDLAAYRPQPSTRRNGQLRLLFVGGRWEQKGGPELVETLRPHLGRTVRLDVVTPTPPDPVEGMFVHSGTPGSGDVARLFAQADVFCLPTRVDAVPWVVVEAMASGVPVISTTVGSIPELVGDAGRTIQPGDTQALGEALGELLGSAELRATMGEAGRARAEERYDAVTNTGALVELLQDAVDQHRVG